MEGGGFCVPQDAQSEGQAGGFCGSSCCENCGCLSFSQEFYQAYKVMVCQSCRRSDKYKLIPKGAAKSLFMLTEGDMRRLGTLTKPNPRGTRFADMKLYLQSQVVELAMKKHGSSAAIQDVKQARVEARIASRVERAKRTAAGLPPDDLMDAEQQQGNADQPLNAAQQRVRDRLLAEYGSGGSSAQGAWATGTDTQLSGPTGAQVIANVEGKDKDAVIVLDHDRPACAGGKLNKKRQAVVAGLDQHTGTTKLHTVVQEDHGCDDNARASTVACMQATAGKSVLQDNVGDGLEVEEI